MIRLRIDVDYPYPSRFKSFLYTALNAKVGSGYLKNSKILARMVNESREEVKAYWFFTYKTLPDNELLDRLDSEKHEVALHVANRPYCEMELLEKVTRRQIRYYTIHGTARLLGRILWKRWKTQVPEIPRDFPLESFHRFPTVALDARCYMYSTTKTAKIAKDSIAKGMVLEIHPEWLFQRGTLNHRGPYYSVLRKILKVDKELGNLAVRKKGFIMIARNAKEYEKDVFPTEQHFEKLRERGIDVFTFIERKWRQKVLNPPRTWIRIRDNIALLQITSYNEWWKTIGKKTRNMIRKAKKSGVTTKVAVVSEELVEGIWGIYNETPIRQGREFSHYGVALQTVERRVLSSKSSTFIGAYLEDELLGFIQLVHRGNTAIISQILSLQKHWNKSVNNALLAEAIEFCANKKVEWLIYGRMGNHPSLDKFKQSSGFTRFPLTRYYIPLTKKGKIAVKFGLYREIKDALPQRIKYPLIPIYNWISRTKIKIKKRVK